MATRPAPASWLSKPRSCFGTAASPWRCRLIPGKERRPAVNGGAGHDQRQGLRRLRAPGREDQESRRRPGPHHQRPACAPVAADRDAHPPQHRRAGQGHRRGRDRHRRPPEGVAPLPSARPRAVANRGHGKPLPPGMDRHYPRGSRHPAGHRVLYPGPRRGAPPTWRPAGLRSSPGRQAAWTCRLPPFSTNRRPRRQARSRT